MNKQIHIKLISLLWLTSVIGGGATFGTQVLLARELNPYDYGLFSSTIGIVVLLIPLSGFGIGQFWLKAFGEEGVAAKRWISSSYRVLAVSISVTTSAIIFWAYWGPNEAITKYLLILLIFYVIGQVAIDLLITKYQLEDNFILISILQVTPQLSRLGFIALLLLTGGVDLEGLGLAYATTGFILLTIGVYYLKGVPTEKYNSKRHNAQLMDSNRTIAHDSRNNNQTGVYALLQYAWPFGLSTFFQLIYYQSDIILLKYLSGNEDAGVYNAAFVVLAVVFILPSVIYMKYLMPKIHRWSTQDISLLHRLYKMGSTVMLAIGFFSMAMVLLFSDWGITLLFGEKYLHSIQLLNVLSLSIPVIFLAYNSGAVLTTKDHMRRKVRYMGYSALLNIVLNLYAIPTYGPFGAAATTVLSNVLLYILYSHGVRKYVFCEHSV